VKKINGNWKKANLTTLKGVLILLLLHSQFPIILAQNLHYLKLSVLIQIRLVSDWLQNLKQNLQDLN